MKGFTLIELLAVLLLLAIIALITFPVIDNILDDARNEAYERQKDNILEASRLYVTVNGNQNIGKKILNLQTLIDEGYLKDGEILDPRDTSKEMPGCVAYSWSNDKKQYLIEYSETCDISTPAEAFTYITSEGVDSFDINYDECVAYITDFGYSTEEIDLYCKGESVGRHTIQDDINSGYLDINELKSNNIITNVISKQIIKITDYNNEFGSDVIIPDKINNLDVISIEEGAFAFKGLTSIVLPNYLQTIGSAAFYNNSLTNLTIPSNVLAIDYEAFSYNKLIKLDLSQSIAAIPSGAFSCNPAMLESGFIGNYYYYYDDFNYNCPE